MCRGLPSLPRCFHSDKPICRDQAAPLAKRSRNVGVVAAAEGNKPRGWRSSVLTTQQFTPVCLDFPSWSGVASGILMVLATDEGMPRRLASSRIPACSSRPTSSDCSTKRRRANCTVSSASPRRSDSPPPRRMGILPAPSAASARTSPTATRLCEASA